MAVDVKEKSDTKAPAPVKLPMAALPVGSLRAALKSVLAAVENRNTIPILSNVLVTVTPQHLTVRATDLDVEVSRQVPVNVISDGDSFSFTCAAKPFSQAADKLASDGEAVLTLDAAANRVRLSCARARFNFPTLPVEDFPVMAGFEDQSAFELAGSVLGEMLAHCRPAMSTEETRYYLNGVFFERKEAELFVVATDGHRMHTVNIPAPDGSENLPDAIIPRKTVGLIAAMCGEERISLRLSSGKIAVEAGEVSLVSKLVDGSYPDWRRVVPSSPPLLAQFDPRAVASAVERVRVVASEKTHAVKCIFGKGVLTLEVTSAENGQAREKIELDYQGDETVIGFNAKYLVEVLAQIPGEIAAVQMTDGTSPSRWCKNTGADRFCILMPMRV